MEVHTHPPRIAYRETISGRADGHHRHKKQTGGAGQFGEVFLRIEPLPRGGGFEFVDEVKGGTIPGQFLPAVEKGVRQVLAAGAVAGYPMQDVRVIVYDGKHHPVDSKEVAFIAAGKQRLPRRHRQGAAAGAGTDRRPGGQRARAAHGRRQRRAGLQARPHQRHRHPARRRDRGPAQVPLSELEGYAAELKSVTAGRGRYALDFSHYEPVPAQVQKKLAEAYKPRHDED